MNRSSNRKSLRRSILRCMKNRPRFSIFFMPSTAKDDPHVKGIVARFGSTQPSLTQGQEIRAALARFRESGKFTYAFGTSYGDFGGQPRLLPRQRF